MSEAATVATPSTYNPPKDGNLLLDVRGLKKYFPIQKGLLRRVVGYVKAVDDVTFFVREGETLGLVGESGCGKTTAGRTIIRLYEPTGGEVYFKSRVLSPSGEPQWVNMAALDRAQMKLVRQEIAMIFQDPINSLNPRMSVGDIVAEPMVIHGKYGPDSEQVIISLLERVGLRADHLRRYPHEFSGGQRQRIGIARALSMNPRLVICDEPVSALDVSIQAQTLNLLQDLQKDFNLSYIFVAHDLSVVQHISDRVAVMYVGKMVEMADAEELYNAPLHPYTEALMSAVPKPDPLYKSERIIMQGDVADPSNPPSGCYFHPRCRYAVDICKTKTPEFRELKPDHFVACHRAEELKLRGV
ncbi:ABC transporter ATP-binding protein [Anaerolinea thermophila]|uniref:ABC transporter ATP-binding protein n=1 Tax=Anaerolinea thermophila (strain DSM 14523 / JCM 11388 / NBRC 100420 / UNI-1) TaxID=926569 RepID=E8N3W7_ANATU|nr:oligopeptide/dipeptide ABC transporter ATP-binding protein [Anaerolinea thermophila]BAJ63131.1 ABC transporter ATP-binding protein [Anaerolinea thermophila UNI-1]